MARPLVVRLGDAEIPLHLEKVDRSRLYGWIDVEALDDKGRRCEIAVLGDDGRTVIPRGGRAIAYLAPDGGWCDKSALKPVDPEGKPITPVASSFSAPVPLGRKASIDEYLSHDIRLVYLVRAESDPAALCAALADGSILAFPYSFRGGHEPDAGFLLQGQDGNLFLAVGRPTAIQFVGLQEVAFAEEGGDEEEEGDAMDFGMM